jgi:hypothetical protein
MHWNERQDAKTPRKCAKTKDCISSSLAFLTLVSWRLGVQFILQELVNVTKDELLAAKPRRASGIELAGLRVMVTMHSRTWPRRVLRLPETTTRTFELDERGKSVFEACDGETSIEQIIEKLANLHQLKREEFEAATLKFLDMLLRRGLIVIEVEEKPDRHGPA